MAEKVKIDYSKSFLEPVTYEMVGNGIVLKAGGEEIAFQGDLLKLTPDCAAITLRCDQTKLLTLSANVRINQDTTITNIEWFAGKWSGYDEIHVASTNFTAICAFLRKGKVSFFISLDFPYSVITDGTVSYDPYDSVKTGEIYDLHTLTIGATILMGLVPKIGNEDGLCDRAEIEAMSEYIESRIPTRFNRPVNSSTCITNRMTDVREGRIFYSMYDNPTLGLDPETLHREVDLCAELGIEYYQVFEGYFDYLDDGTSEREMVRLVEHAKKVGVRVGGYVVPGGPHCPHYNYDHRVLAKPEWRSLLDGGELGTMCLGCDEYYEFLSKELCSSIKQHGEEIIDLDMWAIQPCYNPDHKHGPGGLYREVRGLIRLMQDLNETSPHFLTWTNAGQFGEIAPKIVWYNPNIYLNDPHARLYSSCLNLLKYYGDCRREHMVSTHNRYFIPYSYFTNCEYYIFRHSRVEDLAFFEYSFLQGLCVTPNICLAEVRTFLDRIPASKLDYCKSFMKRWLDFIKDNYEVWRHTYQVAGNPQAGANEVYAHCRGNMGFVCLINQNQASQVSRFSLDGCIGIQERGQYLISEVYPSSAPIFEQALPYSEYGVEISVVVPANSVRILRIEPYTASQEGIRLYGIDGSINKSEDDFVIDISGEIGKTYDVAVVLEDGLGIDDLSAQTVKTVSMYTFPTTLSDITIVGNVARFQLTMPRDRFNRELDLWRVDGGEPKKIGFKNSDFCGGYIHNLYKEQQYTQLFIKTRPSEQGHMPEVRRQEQKQLSDVPRQGRVYETLLDIPFIEWPTMALSQGYDEVLELVFTDVHLVKSIRAFINDTECELYRFRYPDSSMYAYCIELVGRVSSGTTHMLRLEIEWQENILLPHTGKDSDEKTDSGVHVLGL